MIKVSNLSKNYKTFRLQNVNLDLPKGYIMGLVGQNGAGKTTLLKILSGMEKADSGDVVINGINVNENEKNIKEVKDDIGFVFLDDLFIDEATLIKNGCIYGKYYTRFDKDTLVGYCNEFELDINRKYKKLSKGEKLKFQLSFALSHSPKLLLLDEPAANFDRDFRKKFMKILTEFVSDGETSVVIATHLTEDLDRIADYVTFMEDGTIRFSMDKNQLEESFRLIKGSSLNCNRIDKKYVIYREDGKYSSSILVDYKKMKNDNMSSYIESERQNISDREITVEIPKIEDIMYYIVKGSETVKKEDRRYV